MITKDQTGETWLSASLADKQEYVERKCRGAAKEGLGTADPSTVLPGNRHRTISMAFGNLFTAIAMGIDYKPLLPPT
jgi:hypothetical protein